MSHFLFRVGKEKVSVVDEMKWNQPLLRGMPRLVDNSGQRANKVGRELGNEERCKATGRRYGVF
jgi:hypothetical protein